MPILSVSVKLDATFITNEELNGISRSTAYPFPDIEPIIKLPALAELKLAEVESKHMVPSMVICIRKVRAVASTENIVRKDKIPPPVKLKAVASVAAVSAPDNISFAP